MGEGEKGRKEERIPPREGGREGRRMNYGGPAGSGPQIEGKSFARERRLRIRKKRTTGKGGTVQRVLQEEGLSL